jgi:hypothetical protein
LKVNVSTETGKVTGRSGERESGSSAAKATHIKRTLRDKSC